ncbi:MAG: hypothetical protein C0485_01560 [Pirellula sp.]|nr:hypothetical protein [Pirellula sp.]
MQIALAILLVSTLTTNGLFALWAATSRRHWFVRTAIYLASISSLLLVPAYEPFIALTRQATVISGGVALRRMWDRRAKDASEASESPAARRFSLLTMLQLMALLGVTAAIAAQTSTFGRLEWQSIGAIGLCSGLSFSLVYWAANLRGRRRVAGVLAALAASTVLGGILGAVDWFVLSAISGGWLQSFPGIGFAVLEGDREATAFIAEWLSILPASALVMLVVVWLWQAMGVAKCSNQRSRWRMGALRVGLAAACLMVATPAARALWFLLTPEPIPIVELPTPNGYDDLLAAHGMMNDNLLVNSGTFDGATATKAELVKAAAEVDVAINRVEKGLHKESMRSLDYDSRDDLDIEVIQANRSLARAMDAAGRLAEIQGDDATSLRWRLNGMKLGFASRRGGLIVDELVGYACTGIGCAGVYGIKDRLTTQQCEETRATVETLLASAEPFSDVAYRDRVWTQHGMGWMAHLWQWLDDDPDANAGFERARLLELAKCRLLMAELTLQAFQQRHGRLPETTQELLAESPSALPIDPFSPTSEAVRFKRAGSGYVLYSLGRDGVDNDGEPPTDDMSAALSEPGDLRLDVEFKPQSQLPATANAAGEAESEAAAVEESVVEVEESVVEAPESN